MNPTRTLLIGGSRDSAALRTLLARHPNVQVVAETDTLRDARRILASRTIHLVFLDLDLPGEDGLAVLPSVPPTARVVLVAAGADGLARAADSDSAGQLFKPVDAGALAAVLLDPSVVPWAAAAASDAAGEFPRRFVSSP